MAGVADVLRTHLTAANQRGTGLPAPEAGRALITSGAPLPAPAAASTSSRLVRAIPR